MRGHFLHLRFKNFSMTLRTFQCEVFWVLLSSSEHSGVPEDSKSSLFSKCWASPPHLPKVGLRQDLTFMSLNSFKCSIICVIALWCGVQMLLLLLTIMIYKLFSLNNKSCFVSSTWLDNPLLTKIHSKWAFLAHNKTIVTIKATRGAKKNHFQTLHLTCGLSVFVYHVKIFILLIVFESRY